MNLIARYAAVLAVGVVVGLTVNSWRLGAQISELEAEHAEQLRDIAQVAAQASQQAVKQQTQAINNLAELDRRYTNEISNAQLENDQLRDAVASGERRLRVQASCPASSDRLPDATTAASVDDAAGPELSAAAERNYFILRQRITLATNQISALQDYINASCLKEAL